MQAFLIDPYKETISEFNFSGNFEDINKAIESRCFTVVNLDEDTMCERKATACSLMTRAC
jgi:hypothetical protein